MEVSSRLTAQWFSHVCACNFLSDNKPIRWINCLFKNVANIDLKPWSSLCMQSSIEWKYFHWYLLFCYYWKWIKRHIISSRCFIAPVLLVNSYSWEFEYILKRLYSLNTAEQQITHSNAWRGMTVSSHKPCQNLRGAPECSWDVYNPIKSVQSMF